MRKEIKEKLVLFGTKKEIQDLEEELKDFDTNRTEEKIRLDLQDILDKGYKGEIMYAGNVITPYTKTIKEYNKYKKKGSIDNLSNFFYNFLTCTLSDIAYYNKTGYICNYGGSFARIQKEVINNAQAPSWRTDLQRVLDKIQTV